MRRQLGQLRPTTTSAEVLFNPSENKPYNIDLIICTNSSGGAVDITIYHDADGTTYDESTEVLATTSLADGQTLEFAPEKGIADYRKTGNVAVKVSSGTTVNFTAYGEIEGEVV